MARARGARAADNAQFEQTEVHVDAITTQPGQILGPPLPVRSSETGDDDKGNLPEEGFGRRAPGLVTDYLAPHPRGLANQAEFDWAETMLYQLQGGGAGWLSDDVCGAAAGGDDDVRDALATLDVDLDGQIAAARGMLDAAYHLNAKRSSVGVLSCFTLGLIVPPCWAMNALTVATFPCITGPICCFPALTGQRCYTHNCICAKMCPCSKTEQAMEEFQKEDCTPLGLAFAISNCCCNNMNGRGWSVAPRPLSRARCPSLTLSPLPPRALRPLRVRRRRAARGRARGSFTDNVLFPEDEEEIRAVGRAHTLELHDNALVFTRRAHRASTGRASRADSPSSSKRRP